MLCRMHVMWMQHSCTGAVQVPKLVVDSDQGDIARMHFQAFPSERLELGSETCGNS
jgi:hypothetical protein